MTVTREENTALFSRTGQEDRYMPLPKRPVGDELAEELRRLDADQIYAEALGAMAGVPHLDERPPMRVHVWKDPALAARAGRRGRRVSPAPAVGRIVITRSTGPSAVSAGGPPHHEERHT